MLQVAACHCRVHETYKRCFLSAAPWLPCKVTPLEEVVKPCRCELLNCLILHLLLSFFYCSPYYFSSFALFSMPSLTSYSLFFLAISFITLSYLPSSSFPPCYFCFFDLLPLYPPSFSSTSSHFPLISSSHYSSVCSALYFLMVPSYHIHSLSATPQTYFNHKPPF